MKQFIKNKKILIILLLISLIIEIFICNFPFFRTLLQEEKYIHPKYQYDGNVIVIKNPNTPITNISITYKENITSPISYLLSYTSSESTATRTLNKKVMNTKNNHFIHFDTHEDCTYISLSIKSSNENLKIKDIVLNKPIININLVRILLIFIITNFILIIKKKSIYSKQYDKTNKIQDCFFKINLSFIIAAICLYIFTILPPLPLLIKPENISKDDTLMMQTEAFINGQVSLMEEPSVSLLELEDPYNPETRAILNVDFLFDTTFYKGKYYSYFGIAPIITSILPLRLLTGHYLKTHVINLIYIITILFSLYSLYKKLIEKYIKKISLFNFYLGYYAIVFGSNILTLLRGEKYDIAITSGLAFLLISLNISISLKKENKHKILKLLTLGFTTSMIVLSKPNFIIYYILILFFLIPNFKNLKMKEKIKNFIPISIPLSIFAIIQMILNYVRFDNILEFGAKYQLTSFNMLSCFSITFGKIYTGFIEYIFKLPVITPTKFPFILPNTDTSNISLNEICYEAKLVGLISIPILYFLLLKSNIIKKEKNKELNRYINISIILTILSIIINTCFGGITEAYSIDFKLILSISSIILGLKWLDQENTDTTNKIFLLLCLATIIIMIPISLSTEYSLLISNEINTAIYFKNLFEFWK